MMNKEQIKAEKDRLRPILFEDAPDDCRKAFLEETDGWHFVVYCNTHKDTPVDYLRCKNQPETTLDWRDTLIKRGDV